MHERVTDDTLRQMRGSIDAMPDMMKAWFQPGSNTGGIQNTTQAAFRRCRSCRC